MKAKCMLLAILGLASSVVVAQSSPTAPGSGQPQGQSETGGQTGSPQQTQPAEQEQTLQGQQPEWQTGTPSSGESSDEYRSEDRPPPAPMTVVEPKTENGFTYMCGGVGADEAKKMKHAARDYDMMLIFATRRGDYLADVNVDIRDARGNSQLEATCDGPIMVVDFPKSGTYRIHAETGGYSLDKTANVKAKGRSHVAMVLSWPQQVAEAAKAEPATSTGSSGPSNGNTNNGNGTR